MANGRTEPVTRERLSEILVCIIERLLRDQRDFGELDRWVSALEARGIAPGETRQVIGWLLGTLGSSAMGGTEGAPGGSRRGVHVLDRNDRDALTIGAQGLLIELRELGLLDDIQVEEVVERALYRGSVPFGRDELGSVIAEVLMDAADANPAGFAYTLFFTDEGAVH